MPFHIRSRKGVLHRAVCFDCHRPRAWFTETTARLDRARLLGRVHGKSKLEVEECTCEAVCTGG